MKKTVMISIMLISVLLLCSCVQQPVVMVRSIRWDESDIMTYTVSMVDREHYSTQQVGGALLAPLNVDGTFVTQVISADSSAEAKQTSIVTTKLDIWSTYDSLDLGDFDESIVDSDYIRYDEETGFVEFRTTVDSYVEFPVYSCKSVTVDTKGAIVICGDSEKGVKNHVEFNDYSVKCESFGSEAVYSLIHNNKAYPDVIDAKLSLGKVTEYTDNASLIFAIRSLDLSLLKEAGSTTMSVTDFVANSLRSVTLSTSSTSPAIESKLGKEIADKYLAVRVATGSSMRGSYNWFYMDTNTDVANGYKNILSLPTGNVSKNRIVAMQQGHLLFVLDGEFDFIGEQPEDGGEAA